MMEETKKSERYWHPIRNDNGEWISDKNVVILTKAEARSLQFWARLMDSKISIQHGYKGELWGYKHEVEAIKTKKQYRHERSRFI